MFFFKLKYLVCLKKHLGELRIEVRKEGIIILAKQCINQEGRDIGLFITLVSKVLLTIYDWLALQLLGLVGANNFARFTPYFNPPK